MEKVEAILQEIAELKGQDDKKAFEKFLEVAGIGRDSENNTVYVMGLMNAAAVACKMGNLELCMKMSTDACNVDEGIWTEYLQEPHMQDMLKKLSEEGVFN